MTTQAEIKKWVQPFIERYPAMVQSGRFLVFRPIGHLMRAVVFWGGSDRHNLNPGWLLCPLCIPPGLMNTFGNDIPAGHTNWPDFHDKFYERTYRVIEWYLLPNTTIQDFCGLAWDRRLFFQSTLSRFPKQHAVLLAALGQFEAAETMLIEPLAGLELQAATQLKRGRALLAKRANSGAGKFDIEQGERDRALANELGRLLGWLRQRDTDAVATLLREWERQNVTKWGVAHLWQPTPFPFEQA